MWTHLFDTMAQFLPWSHGIWRWASLLFLCSAPLSPAPQEQPDANGLEASPPSDTGPTSGNDPADTVSNTSSRTNLFFDATVAAPQNENNNNPCKILCKSLHVLKGYSSHLVLHFHEAWRQSSSSNGGKQKMGTGPYKMFVVGQGTAKSSLIPFRWLYIICTWYDVWIWHLLSCQKGIFDGPGLTVSPCL